MNESVKDRPGIDWPFKQLKTCAFNTLLMVGPQGIVTDSSDHIYVHLDISLEQNGDFCRRALKNPI